ncbi:S8 family serine peptidase [Candidatus Poribacteria bacterium]
MLGKVCLFYTCLITLLISSQGLAEVKIAILDSGCNIEYEAGISFVDNTPADVNGHGTAVAQIIRESNPDAKLYIAKTFTANGRNMDPTPFVKGIYWAISHQVDMINLSCQTRRDEKAIHDAIQKACRQGIIVVAAAGNKGDFLDALMDELSRRNRNPNISTGVKYPAKYKEVVAVGAINSFWRFNRHQKYSPIGAEIEFVCDGSNGSQEGTSFAAARATAIVSRIKADCPDLDGEQLREILKFYAHDLGDKGRDPKFGYGKLEYTSQNVMKAPPLTAADTR